MTSKNIHTPLTLLGGRSPAEFMRTYWQKKPLLIRQAIPGFISPVAPAGLKKLAKRDDVESRLIWQEKDEWNMENGPFARFPKIAEPNWSLLVQSVDLHDDATAALMQQFRFIPDARLDDIMISLASRNGGVGPHFDSYDVFLLQGRGQRRWRISQQKDLSLVPDIACKILQHFEPEEEFVLEPGDMLYLPPHIAHDGISESDECITVSIGFRAPSLAVLARGLLEVAADQLSARNGLGFGPYSTPALPGPDLAGMFQDKRLAATTEPAALPDELIDSALAAVHKITFTERMAARFLGCWLTEPNGLTVFPIAEEMVDIEDVIDGDGTLVLDRRSRMIYRGTDLFINGEALEQKSNALLKKLADRRALSSTDLKKANAATLALLQEWLDDGWVIAHQ
ncbi:MAG TPA: cupin domain-containing protein [Advenella sp.]|nr:cupin domain-containing protein [Advenella sp.]